VIDVDPAEAPEQLEPEDVRPLGRGPADVRMTSGRRSPVADSPTAEAVLPVRVVAPPRSPGSRRTLRQRAVRRANLMEDPGNKRASLVLALVNRCDADPADRRGWSPHPATAFAPVSAVQRTAADRLGVPLCVGFAAVSTGCAQGISFKVSELGAGADLRRETLSRPQAVFPGSSPARLRGGVTPSRPRLVFFRCEPLCIARQHENLRAASAV